MKEFEINHEILVKAPIEKVFEVWTDFEHWSELYPETYESVKVQREGNQVLTEETIKTMAGKQQATIETVLEPPHRYTRYFKEGPMEGSVRTTTLEPSPEGTMIKTHMKVKLGGMIATLIGDLAETLFEKNIEKLSRSHARVAEGEVPPLMK
ncbi:MAG TPA: SRPBCC family protein [Acidobacteriota bacterium]